MTGFLKLRFIISTFPHTTCCRISLLQNPNFRSLPRPKFATTPHTSCQVGTRLKMLDIVSNLLPMTHDQLISRCPQPIGRQQPVTLPPTIKSALSPAATGHTTSSPLTCTPNLRLKQEWTARMRTTVLN